MGCGVGSGRQWERWTVGQRRLLFVVGPGWALRRPWWWVVGAVVGGQAQMNEKVPEGGTRLVWVTARGGLPQKGAVLDALPVVEVVVCLCVSYESCLLSFCFALPENSDKFTI